MSATKQLEDAVFFTALHVTDAYQRKVFLDQSCADNPALRSVVDEMLASQEDAERLLDRGHSAFHLTADEFQTAASEKVVAESKPVDERAGAQIDRYKLLQRIGEGGCGVVYMAEQESPVRRRVALKIIKLGMDTKQVIARFEAERQALALMDHTNIARVLDAGATETGRPYFVMELVKGVRTTEYCDANHLDTRQRLGLFIQICHAIQHAHQKGIIHRDIKPSNILVTMHDGVPMPKVIDFGIAKAIEGKLTEQTLFTAYEQLIGTPAYMSPEQAELSALDVDTRSDIYSLGVLLYELLTGKTPFDGRELVQSGLEEMRRTLREKEPQRPSTKLNALRAEELTQTAIHRRVEPRRLKLLLSGDLDWIVMKALEKDRRRRYQTANDLGMEIQRYLNNDPVIARPPSRLYRFQKLVRRNKIVFAAVTAVTAALVIGLGASTLLFFKEREACQRALAARHEAEVARNNEAKLRFEAEAREKITQARLLVSQDRCDKADELIDRLALTQPTLEGAAVLRTLSEWHVSSNHWQLAASRFSGLLQVNQLDGWDLATVDFLKCGVAMANLNQTNEYERCRQEALNRFRDMANPVVAERMVKLCLLRPAGRDLITRLDPIVERAMRNPGSAGKTIQGSIPDLSLQDFDTRQPHSISWTGNVATIVSGGANIWEGTDQFLFAYTIVSGDFDCRLRVHSVKPPLDDFTRVGLMARESLSNPSCREVTAALNASRTFQMLVRTVTGAGTLSLPPNPLPAASGTNLWIRLQRVGTVFFTYTSTNGTDWARLYQFDSTVGTDAPFADSAYLGIATCAHSADKTVTAVVSDFSLVPILPPNTTLSLALLEFRRGDYAKAMEWSRRCLAHPDYNPARFATAQIILAMSRRQQGEAEAARLQLAQARTLIERKFEGGLDLGGATQGFWFDWVFARILYREATAGIESASASVK